MCRRQLKLSLDLRARRRPTVRTEGYCTLLRLHAFLWFLISLAPASLCTLFVVVHVTASTYAVPIGHHVTMSTNDDFRSIAIHTALRQCLMVSNQHSPPDCEFLI